MIGSNEITSRNDRITLLQLQQRVQRLVAVPETQNVWVTAELSDVAERGGHCYLELIQKDQDGITALAKARAMIWANNWRYISADFQNQTGQRFATGLKVMVRVSASYHPLYGMSLVISAVDPRYTMGDLLQRRREILARLKAMGVLEMNRSLDFPSPTLRIAVVSAAGAAGFGDFMNQLYRSNDLRIRFTVKLFESVMQGDKAPRSIIDSLGRIASESDLWDCVVIIRGGGSTSDLSAFEDFCLAEAVANCPLPVIVGIGHERDVTVLDYVARERVKTPTAAAELLTAMAAGHLEHLREIANGVLRITTECIGGAERQLAMAGSLLSLAPESAVRRAQQRLTGALLSLGGMGSRVLTPQHMRVNSLLHGMQSAVGMLLQRRTSRLDSMAELLAALSPEATLRRGYSITRVGGRCVTDASSLAPGTEIETVLKNGTIISSISSTSQTEKS